MTKPFAFQLLASFVVGGASIGLLSFVAERVSKRIAGIVLTFPTTIAIGFFFLGWTVSPEAVASVVPATLVPLGLSMLCVPVYVFVASYSANRITGRFRQILFSFAVSIGAWFILAAPTILLELTNIAIGVSGYFAFTLTAHLLLKRTDCDKPLPLKYTTAQKAERAAFVGFIIFLVVLLGRVLNPFWGGLFAMFPAANSSVLIIMHWYYGAESLLPTMQNVAIGSLSLFAYAIMAMLTFPGHGFVHGTLFAYMVSLAVTLLLMKIQSRTRASESKSNESI